MLKLKGKFRDFKVSQQSILPSSKKVFSVKNHKKKTRKNKHKSDSFKLSTVMSTVKFNQIAANRRNNSLDVHIKILKQKNVENFKR